MFLGHIGVGLAGKRAAPEVSLGWWIAAVQFVDLLWPIMLLLGLEHVRIAPGITAVTPLDFYDYPITHSLLGGLAWAALFVVVFLVTRRQPTTRTAPLLAGGVLSHWVLDVVSHRPDMPVLPRGPYLGLGLWYSLPATLALELSMFALGIAVYLRVRPDVARRASFWLLIAFLLTVYFGSLFGPPPPSVRVLAVTGLGLWLLIPWAAWVDRRQSAVDSRQSTVSR